MPEIHDEGSLSIHEVLHSGPAEPACSDGYHQGGGWLPLTDERVLVLYGLFLVAGVALVLQTRSGLASGMGLGVILCLGWRFFREGRYAVSRMLGRMLTAVGQ